MRKIVTWVKSHIVILSIIVVVMICSIVVTPILVNNFEDTDVEEKQESKNNSYSKMICSNEYDDGEKVNLEFVYDAKGKNLKKHILIHTEIGLREEDESLCSSLDLLSGISCSFDKTDEPYTYTIELNIEEFDEDSREMINEHEIYNYLLPLSMIEAKKHLIEDESYDGMICRIFDEDGNVVQEEKNITLQTDGYYVATSGEYGYGSIKFYNENKFSWVDSIGSDYGSGISVKGTYKRNGTQLTFNVIEEAYEGEPGSKDSSRVFSFTIIDSYTIKYNGHTYRWQSTSKFSGKH